MKSFQAVVDGVLVRLGTLLSAALLGYGIQNQHVELIVPAFLVIVGVGLDMVVGHFVKKAGR